MTNPDIPAAEQAEAFLAWRRGEPVEFFEQGRWMAILEGATCLYRNTILRRKPAPKLRPWKPEEVKPCLLRYSTALDWQQLLGVNSDGCLMLGGNCLSITTVKFQVLLDNWLHSTDGGRTWSACGVQE